MNVAKGYRRDGGFQKHSIYTQCSDDASKASIVSLSFDLPRWFVFELPVAEVLVLSVMIYSQRLGNNSLIIIYLILSI
jgi:hypothetical protein